MQQGNSLARELDNLGKRWPKADDLGSRPLHHQDKVLDHETEGKGHNHQVLRQCLAHLAEDEKIGRQRRRHTDGRNSDDDEWPGPGPHEQCRHGVDRGHDQGIGTDGNEITLRKVDQAHDPEQQPDPERGQGIETAKAHGIYEGLKEMGHSSDPPLLRSKVPAPK
ncbi:MAG: hypothetical protein IAE87_00955 [Rhodobacteraceae bacterium]|nr:hypothetical protein [Paracoccaceae bacterium]